MGAWPGGWLEGHVGPGGKGANGWPHPFPLARSSSFVPGTPGNYAKLPGLQSKLIFPLCSDTASLPQAWLSQAAVGIRQCLYPPSLDASRELQEPAQRCQEGVPGEPACALWARTDWEGACVPQTPVYQLALSALGSGAT